MAVSYREQDFPCPYTTLSLHYTRFFTDLALSSQTLLFGVIKSIEKIYKFDIQSASVP